MDGPPSQTGYDVTSVTLDFTATPKMVTINFSAIGGTGQGGFVQMTHAKFDSYPGAGMRMKALNALASIDGLNLAGATVA